VCSFGGNDLLFDRLPPFPASNFPLCSATIPTSNTKSAFPGSSPTVICPPPLRRPDAKHIPSPHASHAFSSLHVLITGRPAHPSAPQESLPPADENLNIPSKTPEFYVLCLQGIARSEHLHGRPLRRVLGVWSTGSGIGVRGCRVTSRPRRCRRRIRRARVRSGFSLSK
jgi:hypothetical protein